MVGFQGWLGAKVVASYLSPIMITIHMAIALLLIGVLWYVYFRASKKTWQTKGSFTGLETYRLWIWLLVVATFIQILVGTQVREEIDAISYAMNYIGRGTWVGMLKGNFMVHRVLSYVIAFTTLVLVWKTWHDTQLGRSAKKVIYGLVILIAIEVIIGYILVFLQLPAFAQPLHLLVGSMILGVELVLLMVILNSTYSSKPLQHAK